MTSARSNRSNNSSTRRWTLAWVTMCLALALHVVDEATHGFLEIWNPLVVEIRRRVPFVPLPTFTFEVWLGGLIAGVALLLSLTRWVRHGARWMAPVSYAVAVFMCGNGLLHLTGSVYTGRMLPGVYSAPVLVGAAAFLVVATRRRNARPTGPSAIENGRHGP